MTRYQGGAIRCEAGHGWIIAELPNANATSAQPLDHAYPEVNIPSIGEQGTASVANSIENCEYSDQCGQRLINCVVLAMYRR